MELEARFQFALIHGPNIPGSYAKLLFTAPDLASITSPIHNRVLFLVWLHPFILSGVISPLISSSILGTYRPGEFLLQNLIILHFHTVHGVLKARILKWFVIPFSSGIHYIKPLHHDPSILGGPTQHVLASLKAVFRVIRFASFLWLWFQCLCPLMPSFNTYCLTWISLTLDVQYLFTTLQQSAATAPCLGHGVVPLPDLGCGVASLGLCPWLWPRGSSCRPCFRMFHHCCCASARSVAAATLLQTFLPELRLMHPTSFAVLCFHFCLLQSIFLLFISSMIHQFFRSVCLIFTYLWCVQFSSCYWFLVYKFLLWEKFSV